MIARFTLGLCCSLTLAFALTCGLARAAVGQSFSFTVVRAPHPLPLDAALSDPAWAAGKVPEGSGPWQNVTTRAPSHYPTTAYLLYDDKNLYVGFKAKQDGVPITATQTTNDVGFGVDDFVGIGIANGGGGSQSYYFEATPRGIRYEQSNENVRFRPRWSAAGATTSSGWSAVLIIPLDVLRVPHGGKQTWHLQFVRQVAARGEHLSWVWNPIMGDSPSGVWPGFQTDTRFWAAGDFDIAASAAARPKPRADIYGLASMGEDRNLFQQANGEFAPEPVRYIGGDVSYPLTPTIRFVGTLNPDFSNVEIDQQTIVPQEFQRQLLEYRPFFAQGANFINADSGPRSPTGPPSTPSYLIFYSPSVGPFDSGAKVEGTFGNQSFGALTFHGYDVLDSDTFSDQAYGYQHALPNGSFIYWSDGVFANHSVGGTDDTVEAGAEARDYSNGMIYYFDHAFESGTWVPQGNAGLTQFWVDRHKDNFEVNGGYFDVSPNYNPIDGYTPNSDLRGPAFFTDYTGATPAIKNYTIFIDADRFTDESGAVHQADTQFNVSAVFKNLFSLDGVGEQVGQLRSYGIPQGPGCSGPTIYDSSFTGYPCYRDGVTQPYNLYGIPVGYRDGTPSPIDADYQWGPFGDDYVHLFSLTTSRPLGKRLSLGLEYDGTYERALDGGELQSQWLRRVSLGYNLTNESSLSLELRDINGLGGFANAYQVGNNLAVAYHQRFSAGDELYVNFGSPASGATLNRLIVKFVLHEGADEGT